MGEIKTLVGNPTKKPITISVEDLEEHPYHWEMYDTIQDGFFGETFILTKGKPIHAPVVVRNELNKMNRLKCNNMNYEKFPDTSADELRTMFPEANFLEAKFDNSVMGINLDTCQVIYHEWYMIFTLIMEINERKKEMDFNDEYSQYLYEECEKTVYLIEQSGSVSANKSLPPIVCRDVYQLGTYSFYRSLENSQL